MAIFVCAYYMHFAPAIFCDVSMKFKLNRFTIRNLLCTRNRNVHNISLNLVVVRYNEKEREREFQCERVFAVHVCIVHCATAFFSRCIEISIYRMRKGKRVRMCVINPFEHEICLKWKQSEMHLIDWPR